MKKSPRLSATEGLAFSQEKTLAWKDDREGAGVIEICVVDAGKGGLGPSHPHTHLKSENQSRHQRSVISFLLSQLLLSTSTSAWALF